MTATAEHRPEPAPPSSRRLSRIGPLTVLCASGLGATILSWFVAQHSLIGARWWFYAPVGVWLVLWVTGAMAATRLDRPRLVIGLVLFFALTTRLAAATGTTPSISNDLYRYGWDARVQTSGIDPYRYPPDAPQLDHLRQAPWFPDAAGCAHIGDRPGCTTMNRPSVRTIYPPVAEAWFDAIYLIDPGGGVRSWQIAGGLVDMATIALLMIGLGRSGSDPRRAAWYALSPIAVVEFAGNGHVDGLALLLLIAALLALQRGRRAAAGVLIGMATMVKIYPGLAVIAAWRKGRLRMLVAAAAVIVTSELPHVVAVGARIVGYIPGYLNEEHYDSGRRFLILGLLPLPSSVITALAALVMIAAAIWVLRRDLEPAVGLTILLSVALLVACPVQPWYAVTLAGIGILAGAPWAVLPALAAEPYYAAVILADPHQVAVGRATYGTAALLVLALAVRAAASRGRRRRYQLDLVGAGSRHCQ